MDIHIEKLKELDTNFVKQYEDYCKVCDLLLDAYLMGFNQGYSEGFKLKKDPETLVNETLEELVDEAGLDPKVVLRRLYCPQQTEDNGECNCE